MDWNEFFLPYREWIKTGKVETMTDEEIKILQYIITHPRAELQQICVGVRLPVLPTSAALDALMAKGAVQMNYGNGGAGTQYVVKDGKKMLDRAFAEVAKRRKA